MENKELEKKKGYLGIAMAVLLMIIVLACGLFYMKVNDIIKATKSYNEAVRNYNLVVEEYNNSVALTSVNNIESFPDSLELLSEESENFSDNAAVVMSRNSKAKILADTTTIIELTQEIKNAIGIINQITEPKEEWVKQRLEHIPEITGIQSVTKEMDPDQLLGKDRSYSSCIYFTVSNINPHEVVGKTIVEKGTDAGGAIEVYASLEDAEARCSYLSGFDDTVLYSGSYAILGTMVIRTSYKLDNQQQYELTSKIVNEFTIPENQTRQ